MDYDFLRDITGQIKARFSMGHEVIGHWLNEEIDSDLSLLDKIEAAAAEIKGSERSWQMIGREYTLWLDEEEVMVRANQLDLESDGMEEGMNYYDEESLSFCGMEDFLLVLQKYRAFIVTYR
ncbi:protein YacL [Rouxiella sp. T17]|uniref:protein YacL n=1 Tax=Rouxiella sp. T17 TaxID=3085684 RepID=UPI002FC94524